MEVELLEKIAKNMEHKTSFQIIVSDNETSFNMRFNAKIELDRDKVYEIALVNLETYYSFPNIDESNNIFVYSPDNGNSWVKIKIPEGSYEIDDSNNTIQQEMKKKGHYDSVNEDYHINISANSNTLKSVLILEKDYQVDFNHRDSLAKVLGFTGTKYTGGFHESENVVDILRINSILVNIDIISGSYVNGATKNTIYSFFPKVSPGYKIIESPVNLVYLPITLDTLDSLNLYITDQDDHLLNLRNEKLMIRFHIREATKMTRYMNTKVNISEGQKEKLQHAIEANCSAVSIRLGHEDLRGNDIIAITESQAKELAKAYENGKGIMIRMSSRQLKHNKKVEGGFLGLLAGLAARALPMLARTVLPALGVGALSGLASTGVQKAMGSGLYLKKGGLVSQVETDGHGLYLKPYKGKGLKSHGDGLYLKQGGKLYDGKGLLLGLNSPFANIPILGAILENRDECS